MSTLNGRSPKDTYTELLKLETPLSSTLQTVEAGDGIDTPLKLSTLAIALNGITWPTSGATAGKILQVAVGGTAAEWVDAPSSLPSQTGNSGSFLTTNGTTASWAAIPQEVASQTGNSGKVLTTNGTATSWIDFPTEIPSQTSQSGNFLTTNGTTVSWAAVPQELPSQTGNSGKYLTTNGTTASWATISGGGSVGGTADGQVQYKSGTSFAASANFTFATGTNSTLSILGGTSTITNTQSRGNLNLTAGSTGSGVESGSAGGITLTAGSGVNSAGQGDGSYVGVDGGHITLIAGSGGSNGSGNGGDAGSIFLSTGIRGTLDSGGAGGYIKLSTGSTALTERLRILANGAWSIGSDGTSTGSAGSLLVSNGSSAAPTWQATSALVGLPYDVGTTVAGKLVSSSVILTFVAVRNFTIPSSYTGSMAKAAVAAFASCVLDVKKNGTSIGTITFAAGSSTGVFSGTAGSFTAGDILTIVGPSTADTTLADIGVTLMGATS